MSVIVTDLVPDNPAGARAQFKHLSHRGLGYELTPTPAIARSHGSEQCPAIDTCNSNALICIAFAVNLLLAKAVLPLTLTLSRTLSRKRGAGMQT